jgi:phage repressor protein C with HTH and peptisase S24 domain
MIGHREIWAALDALAAEQGLSPSGLARVAGLDPTSFNPSKRATREGRPRWPGTESLARALAATGVSLERFAQLARDREDAAPHSGQAARLIDFSQLGEDGLFDAAGLPQGPHWESWHVLPRHLGASAFAVRVDGHALEPVFRTGTILVLAPGAQIRAQDRAIARTDDGAIIVGIVVARKASATSLTCLASRTHHTVLTERTRWLHRIAMASL